MTTLPNEHARTSRMYIQRSKGHSALTNNTHCIHSSLCLYLCQGECAGGLRWQVGALQKELLGCFGNVSIIEIFDHLFHAAPVHLHKMNSCIKTGLQPVTIL